MIADALVPNASRETVSVDVVCADARMRNRFGLGHIGSLVKLARADLPCPLAATPEDVTVFSLGKASEIGRKAAAAGQEQGLLPQAAGPKLSPLVDVDGEHTVWSDEAAPRLEDTLFQDTLANAAFLYPKTIVLSQEVTGLLPELCAALHERVVHLLPHVPAIEPSRLGDLASLCGASNATLSEIAPSLRRLLS